MLTHRQHRYRTPCMLEYPRTFILQPIVFSKIRKVKVAICRRPKIDASLNSGAADVFAMAQSQCIIIDNQPVACSGACIGLWRGGKAGSHSAVIALLQRPLHMLVKAEALIAAAESERSVSGWFARC